MGGVSQEILIKNGKGKLPLPAGSLTGAFETKGFRVLAITGRHVESTRRFAQAISDPFDRLLVATAAEEGMLLVTQNEAILEPAEKSRLPVADVS